MFDKISNIVIKISNRCDLNCPFCFEKDTMFAEPFNDYLSLYNFLYKVPLDTNTNIKFIGGEPLVEVYEMINCIRILKRLERVKDVTLHFGMTTNGNMPDKFRYIVNSGLMHPSNIRISWDGKRKTIFNLQKYGNYVTVRIPLIEETVSNLSEYFEDLLYCDFKNLEYFHLVEYPMYEDEEFLDTVEQELLKIKELQTKYEFRFINQESMIETNVFARSVTCRHLGNTLYITTNGDIYPCGLFSRDSIYSTDFYIGNIYKGFFKDRLKLFIDEYKNTTRTCTGCSNYHCFECPAVTYFYKRNMFERQLYSCELNNIEKKIFGKANDSKIINPALYYKNWDINYDIPNNLPFA